MLRYAALLALVAAPQVAIQTPSSPRAPQTIAVISCQVDDLTGQPGRHGVDELGEYHPEWAAKDWRDLELKFTNGELTCKREVIEIQDRDEVVNNSTQLNHNFGNPAQCVHAAALFFTVNQWDAHHGNWAVVAVGCPTPIVDSQGKIVGWHMPECPSHLPGNHSMPMRCNFSESEI